MVDVIKSTEAKLYGNNGNAVLLPGDSDSKDVDKYGGSKLRMYAADWKNVFGNTSVHRQPPPVPLWSKPVAERNRGKLSVADYRRLNEPDVPLRERVCYHKKHPIDDRPSMRNRAFPGEACSRCLLSKDDAIHSPSIKQMGLANIFNVRTQKSEYGRISRFACYFVFSFSHTKRYNYQDVSQNVISSPRVATAIMKKATLDIKNMNTVPSPSSLGSDSMSDDDDDSDVTLDSSMVEMDEIHKATVKYHRQRATSLLHTMKATISSTFINVAGWFLLNVLRRILSSIQVHKGQLELVRLAAEQSSRPLVFLPLHRSHLDYIILTLTLWNFNLKVPHVAAGNNLNIPLFGKIMKLLGGFFIKRKLDPNPHQRDLVYRAVLHQYMLEILGNKQNLEFFIEGGRSRSGRAGWPKAGLLSVVMDACGIGYDQSVVSDVYLVPVSVSYERLLDGDFTREQLGDDKIPETFLGAIRSIWKVFTSDYGNVRVSFAQPYSLQSLVQSLQSDTSLTSSQGLSSAVSLSSLYGIAMSRRLNNQRELVENVARHVIHGAVEVTVCMSTSVISFLLLTRHRQGCTLATLVKSLTYLSQHEVWHRREVGFSGTSQDVCDHALSLLSPTLVCGEELEDGTRWVGPQLDHLSPSLSLSYLAAPVQSALAVDSIVAVSFCYLTSLHLNEVGGGGKSYSVSRSDLTDSAAHMCDIFQYDFCFCKPCESHSMAVSAAIDRLIAQDIIEVVQDSKSLESIVVNDHHRRLLHRLDDLSHINRTSSPSATKRDGVGAKKQVIYLPEALDDDSGDEGWGSEEVTDEEDDEYNGNVNAPPLIILKIENPSKEQVEELRWYSTIIGPCLESYWLTSNSILLRLTDNALPESTFFGETLTEAKERFGSGEISFSESVALENIKNAVKFFTFTGFIRTYYVDDIKMMQLEPSEDVDFVESFVDRLAFFKTFATASC